MSTITPNTILAIGTKVQVKWQRGVVVDVKVVNAVPSGLISVHTIEFSEVAKTVRNSAGLKATVFTSIKKHQKQINYSFIEVI